MIWSEGGILMKALKEQNKFRTQELLEGLPVEIPGFSIEDFEVREKVYHQKVYYNDELVNERPFWVLVIIPKKEIKEINVKVRNKEAVLDEISIQEEQISIQASIFSKGNFLIRFYKKPIKRVNLSPPDEFKKEIRSKNGDNI